MYIYGCIYTHTYTHTYIHTHIYKLLSGQGLETSLDPMFWDGLDRDRLSLVSDGITIILGSVQMSFPQLESSLEY